MRIIIKNLLFTVAISSIFFACKDKAKSYLPNPGGKAGELMIVINDSIKKSDGGKALIDVMTQPVLGLPQEEPLFDLTIFPHRGVNGYMKTFRSLILVDVSTKIKENKIEYYENAWSKEQALVKIFAKNTESLQKLIQDNEIKLVSFFLKAERQRSIKYFKAYVNGDAIDFVKDTWKFYMLIPNSYNKNKGGEAFSWFSNEANYSSQGIIIYSFDYEGEKSVSKENLLQKRDSVLKINVPGSFDGSYMTTEHRLPISSKAFLRDSLYTVELRGLWKVQGDLMGGPFVSFATVLPERNKVIVTEGYVYSPEKPNKRNLIRQQEALLYSVDYALLNKLKAEK